MYFLTFVTKNLARRPLRSLLTVTSVAIAIGAFVGLLSVTQGFQNSFLKLYRNADVQLIVVRAGSRQRLTSSLPEKLGDEMRALPGVRDIFPGLADMVALPDINFTSNDGAGGAEFVGSANAMVLLQGWIPETNIFNHLKIVAGEQLKVSDKQGLLLGQTMARNLDKKVGDTIYLFDDKPYKVVGLYQAGNVFEDGAIVLSLLEFQENMSKKGEVTGFSIALDEKLKPDEIRALQKQIEGLGRNIAAMSTREHVETLSEIKIANAMAWLTSTIALMIGTFGMMNTMVMSVHERTREIGTLRAVGWQASRVTKMIVTEAVVLSLLGAVLGIVGGGLILQLLTRVPMVNGLIGGEIESSLIWYGLLIALGVGVVGSLLPAHRATQLSPTAALRYE